MIGYDDSGQEWVKEYNGHNLPLKVGMGLGKSIMKLGPSMTEEIYRANDWALGCVIKPPRVGNHAT